MKKIGITGGIGSGKTTVCKVFESLEIPVYYADLEAKNIYSKNTELKKQVIQHFGKEAYQKNGRINRSYLSEIVFNDRNKLKTLNHLVHPAVAQDFDEWCELNSDAKYIVKEAALLIETGSYKNLDYLIYVSAPQDLRINRVVSRDNSSRSEVISRMNNQMAEADKIPYADLVLKNDNETLLVPLILQIHEKFSQ